MNKVSGEQGASTTPRSTLSTAASIDEMNNANNADEGSRQKSNELLKLECLMKITLQQLRVVIENLKASSLDNRQQYIQEHDKLTNQLGLLQKQAQLLLVDDRHNCSLSCHRHRPLLAHQSNFLASISDSPLTPSSASATSSFRVLLPLTISAKGGITLRQALTEKLQNYCQTDDITNYVIQNKDDNSVVSSTTDTKSLAGLELIVCERQQQQQQSGDADFLTPLSSCDNSPPELSPLLRRDFAEIRSPPSARNGRHYLSNRRQSNPEKPVFASTVVPHLSHHSSLKGPHSAVIHVHLPHQQQTAIAVREDVTLQEALYKKLKVRQIEQDKCVVEFLEQQPSSKGQKIIAWSTLTKDLAGEELIVREIIAKENDAEESIEQQEQPKSSRLSAISTTSGGVFSRLSTLDVPNRNRIAVSPRAVLRVHLPNSEITTIAVQPGVSVRQALLKRLRNHQVDPDQCTLEQLCCQSNAFASYISWSADTTDLAGQELMVRNRMPTTPTPKQHNNSKNSIRHKFVKQSISLQAAFCEHCGKLLFQALRCKRCQAKFHKSCSEKSSPYCQPLSASLSKQSFFAADHEGQQVLERFHHRNTGDCPCNSQSSVELLAESEEQAKLESPAINTSPHDMAEAADPPTARTTDDTSFQANGILLQRNQVLTRSYCVKKADHRRLSKRHTTDRIAVEEIRVGKRVGSGSFGTVHRGVYYGPIAVKYLNVENPGEEQLKAFENEVDLLRHIRHPRIILFMGYVAEPRLAIVTEWCEGSSLYKHLHIGDEPFNMMQRLDIAKEVAEGMSYLHFKDIIHRDLKSNNIFLTDDWNVKIGDFGLATIKSNWTETPAPLGNATSHVVKKNRQPTGSILWMAPEVIKMRGENPYSTKSDVYSFGVVIFELITGKLPYAHISNKDQILFQVGRGALKPDWEDTLPETPTAFKNLGMQCCCYDSKERPNFDKARKCLMRIQKELRKLERCSSDSGIYIGNLSSNNGSDCPFSEGTFMTLSTFHP